MGLVSSLSAEFFAYYKAILARAMFGTHALVAVWRTTVVMGMIYWALSMGVFLLAVEYVITMWVRMGKEWAWVSPSTLCYLSTTASALWIQKLESLGHVQSINGSYISTLPALNMQMDFSAADWLLLTEQTMMVTIILSRWLLPKGDMSNKDLSSLLLLYLGLSADILDFSTIFSEPKVAADKTICYVILMVWTGSLAQFILVLTNTTKVEKESQKLDMKSLVCSSEIWQILVQVGLQDFPFLLIRVLAITTYQVFNYTIIFFVCKNTLVIALEVYHLVALCVEQRRKLKKRRARVQQLKSKIQSHRKTMATLGKWKSSKAPEDTKNIVQDDKEDANDSGISATSTPMAPKKSSLLAMATKLKQDKSKADTGSEKKYVDLNNKGVEETEPEQVQSDNEGKGDAYPKSGSRLAKANNRYEDPVALNARLLTKTFPTFDKVSCSTPPISHLQTSRVHSPLAASFDTRPSLSSIGSSSQSLINERTGSVSSVLTNITTTSSVFDVDDSVF